MTGEREREKGEGKREKAKRDEISVFAFCLLPSG
jgi:hypothetical protein